MNEYIKKNPSKKLKGKNRLTNLILFKIRIYICIYIDIHIYIDKLIFKFKFIFIFIFIFTNFVIIHFDNVHQISQSVFSF